MRTLRLLTNDEKFEVSVRLHPRDRNVILFFAVLLGCVLSLILYLRSNLGLTRRVIAYDEFMVITQPTNLFRINDNGTIIFPYGLLPIKTSTASRVKLWGVKADPDALHELTAGKYIECNPKEIWDRPLGYGYIAAKCGVAIKTAPMRKDWVWVDAAQTLLDSGDALRDCSSESSYQGPCQDP